MIENFLSYFTNLYIIVNSVFQRIGIKSVYCYFAKFSDRPTRASGVDPGQTVWGAD